MSSPAPNPRPPLARRALALFFGLLVLVEARPASGDGELPFLLELPGVATSLRYVPGALDRAAHLQRRFELLAHDFASWSGRRVPLVVYVLDREDWESMGAELPYGLALPLGDGVATAARGDAGTIALWREVLGGPLPASPGFPLGATPEEVASLALNDLVTQVAASRVLLRSAGISFDRSWVFEVAAHTVALSAFARHETPRLAEIERVFTTLSTAPTPSSPANAALRNRLAREGRYSGAARILYQRDGARAAKRLLKLARRGDGRLGEAELLARYPGLAPWRPGGREGPAPGAPSP